MPRKPRAKSENNIYHIILRGINHQQIFLDMEDNFKFLEILRTCKALCGYKIFAYCLMGNHIHLLMQFEDEAVEIAMKRISVRFVYWYNTKYERVGHLFQDRFRSEPIGDDRYFLACLRYIHQNPVKAGISKIDEYPFSSYGTYIGSNKTELIDMDLLYSIIAKEDFVDFSNEYSDTTFLDVDIQKRNVTDEEAVKIILKVSKCKNVTDFQAIDIKEREKCLSLLKKKGLGVRQISRLTGISYYVVQKA